jgi:hypothetical protein
VRKRLLQWALAALLATCAVPAAHAQKLALPTKLASSWLSPITWKCVLADGSSCPASDLTNGWYKQVFITSSGFEEADRDAFWSEFDRVVSSMTNTGKVWSTQYRDRLIFVGYFTPGGPLNSDTAAFGGKIAPHPFRGLATSLSQPAVYDKIAQIAASEIRGLNPFAACVILNSAETNVTANAAPPSFVQKAFGVAKFTRGQLSVNGPYITSHELAHAGLNFLDEYTETGLDELSIRQLDVMTPLALFNWTWGGFVNAIGDLLKVYDYNVSEILAANGNDNIALSPWPSTVLTPGYSGEHYAYEHGMFFGRGTFHMAGKNLMNSERDSRGPDDGRAQAHSPSQQRVIDEAFSGIVARPNDRIRNAGPKAGWKGVFGPSTHVMLYDGDRRHHFQPTRSYTVQVGWYERVWRIAWKGIIPYPTYDDVWRTAQTIVAPANRSIDLKMSALYGLANLAQQAACAVGITSIPKPGDPNHPFQLCQQDLSTIVDNFVPTVTFPSPYQDVEVPASQWWTTYWWRFSTNNGRWQSGWTGWSSFYRSL